MILFKYSQVPKFHAWRRWPQLVLTVAVCCAGIAAAQTPATPGPAATNSPWDSRGCVDDARGKWFRDAKFGAFIHFGLYSELGGYYHGQGPYDPAEQIMGLGDRHMVIPWKTYQTEVAAHLIRHISTRTNGSA
jgi:hypothetical protein